MTKPRVVIYTRRWCGYCTAALGLLDGKGIPYEHVDATGNAELRSWLAEQSGQQTVPQIFIDGRSIGGYSELRALDQDGKLAHLVPPA